MPLFLLKGKERLLRGREGRGRREGWCTKRKKGKVLYGGESLKGGGKSAEREGKREGKGAEDRCHQGCASLLPPVLGTQPCHLFAIFLHLITFNCQLGE